MFKFNFTNEEITKGYSESQEQKWLPAKELYSSSQNYEFENIRTFICGQRELKHLAPADVLMQLTDVLREEVIQSEILHSDLIPAKYEGGLKIWECTRDLLEFLLQENVDMKGKQVLDLGCGAGLLGILALLQGAKSVHFQDYNASVIYSLTISNVKLNTDVLEKCRFFAGDWESFAELLIVENLKYDLILTSETIYNSENHKKLCILLEKLLKPDGICYLAAKTYYFGVGGGVRQFERRLEEHGVQESRVCWKCSEGIQREILKISFK